MAQVGFPQKHRAVGLIAIAGELPRHLAAARPDLIALRSLTCMPSRNRLDGFQCGCAQYRRQHAERAENARHRRHHDARNAQLTREIRRMHAPLPPNAINVRSRGSRPRSTVTARTARAIVALATARMPCAASSRVGVERVADMGTDGSLAFSLLIDIEIAARQRRGVDEAEHNIGIRHCRPFVAEPIAGRPRNGASGLRADDQQAALVDAGNGAAAGVSTSAISIAGTLSI